MTILSQLVSPTSHHDTHDLLEDWSSNSSSSIEGAELEPQRVDEFHDHDAMPKPKTELNPRVSFSETSLLRVYKRDEAYTKAKAYSEVDYDLFRFSMLLDARRVKELITRAPPESKKDSVKFLIENKVIDVADLVGIEHFVLGNGGFVVKARKMHIKKVLLLQQQLEQRQHLSEDPAECLAKVAKDSSLKSIYHARIRSAVVAS